MRIKTDGKANFVKVEPGETIMIEFCPDGVNATEHSHRLGFMAVTQFMPDGKMSLALSLPKGNTYRVPGNELVLFLHGLEGYEKLTFKQGDEVERVELERYG